MAAIDYSVCVHSEFFVTTQGGNFPHFLIGHRRYLYGGHAKTIKPNKRRLAVLFDSPHIGYVTTVNLWTQDLLLTTDFLMPLHSWFSKVNFILLKYILCFGADGRH
jgi:hypothetical protein